jgi:nitrate/nitrite-specific signal transduction histidine kinase
MLKLQNLRIKTKLLLLCGIMLVGLLLFGLISFNTVSEIEVNGPVYHRIVQGKNLIADILPPPAYILESYLRVMQLQDEADPKRRELLIEELYQLRKKYYERNEFWRKTLPEGPMRDIIAKKSFDPAAAFYGKLENEFIPAVLSNDRNRINSVKAELDRLYRVHRKAIDELVALARKSNSAEEQMAAAIIRRRKMLLYAVACLMMAAIAASLLGVRQILTNNVLKLVSVTERFSAGDLTARTGLQGRDEFSEVGRAFDHMADKIERDRIVLRKHEEELERINQQLRGEIFERKQAENERDELIAQLKDALAKIKTLTGLLSICSVCKKIRNDKGSWEQLEVYIRDHSEADFSHTICPECVKASYPDFDLKT